MPHALSELLAGAPSRARFGRVARAIAEADPSDAALDALRPDLSPWLDDPTVGVWPVDLVLAGVVARRPWLSLVTAVDDDVDDLVTAAFHRPVAIERRPASDREAWRRPLRLDDQDIHAAFETTGEHAIGAVALACWARSIFEAEDTLRTALPRTPHVACQAHVLWLESGSSSAYLGFVTQMQVVRAGPGTRMIETTCEVVPHLPGVPEAVSAALVDVVLDLVSAFEDIAFWDGIRDSL